MTPYCNIGRIAAAFSLVLLFGVKAGAQDDTKAELAKLRAEVAKLRAEIKSLTATLRDKETGQTFQGKPASVWLRQLEDADPQTRHIALHAIGALARKDKTLVARLVTVLRGSDDELAQDAALVLLELGPAAFPKLLEVAKDRTPESQKARRHAIWAAGYMEGEPKPAVPVLILALKDDRKSGLVADAVEALGRIGPDARAAIPSLVNLLELRWRDAVKNNDPLDDRVRVLGEVVCEALCNIDADIVEMLPRNKLREGFPRAAGQPVTFPDGYFRNPAEAPQQWRQAIDALKKKYPAAK